MQSKNYQGYSKEDLQSAISAVKQNRLKMRPAAREYAVPVTTLRDRIKGTHPKPRAGPDRQLTDEEESALANYLLYMARHGLVMTRAQIRCYILEIVRRSGRTTWFNVEKGPSDEWFRKFLKRHSELSEKIPSRYIIVVRPDGPGKRRLSGRLLQGGYPQRSYNDGIPETWLFAYSDTGYMDGYLFFSWFSEVFLKHCTKSRPVLLILDNHDAHITLQTVEFAIANNVVMLGLPAHTTHYLQPLDVKIIGPLKNRFATMAGNLGLLSTRVTIGKSQFQVILKYAIGQATSLSVQEAFVATGIHPYDPTAIDQSQIVPATFGDLSQEKAGNSSQPSDNVANNSLSSDKENVSTCETCGVFLVNPLVRLGLVPQRMADIFIPPPNGPMSQKKSRIVSSARVLTGGEMLHQLREKETVLFVQEIEKEERAQLKEQRKEQKEKDEEERKKKKQKKEEEREQRKRRQEEEKIQRAVGGRLAPIQFTCGVCNQRGRVNDERNGVMWFGCDNDWCERWFHEFCLSQCEREAIAESERTCGPWCCCVCKPWLYAEEE